MLLSLRMIAASIVLCSLVRSAAATTVEDTDWGIQYDNTWVEDPNEGHSQGRAHRTNITGGTATYSFTGTVIALYGVTHLSGANFSFSINDAQSKNCTCFADNGWSFKIPLCNITGIDGTKSHTLTVKHTDVSGLWLNFDYLDVVFTSPSVSITASSGSTSPTNSATNHKSSSSVGAIVGGVLGGFVGLGILVLAGLWMLMKNQRRNKAQQQPLGNAPVSGSNPGAGKTAPSAADGDENMQSTMPVLAGGMRQNSGPYSSVSVGSAPPTSSTYVPPHDPSYSVNYYSIPSTGMPMSGNNSNTYETFAPSQPQAVYSTIERASPTAQVRNNDVVSASLYPAEAISESHTSPASSLASAARAPQMVSRSSYQPLAMHEATDEAGDDVNATASSFPQVESAGHDAHHASSDIEGWRSTVGSPAPPSYRTGLD